MTRTVNQDAARPAFESAGSLPPASLAESVITFNLITYSNRNDLTFEARTSGSEDLKAIISAISTLVEEATFVATSEGITFRGMDPSHVALIDISWPNSAFEKYNCDSENKFGVRIDEFSKIIKRAEKKDSIEISIHESMLLVNIGKNKKYKMRMIESSATDTPLPKIPYDSKITLPASKFEKILGDVQVVSEYLTIHTENTNADFSGKGDSGEVIINVGQYAADVKTAKEDAESPDSQAAKEAADPAASQYSEDIEISSKEDSTGTYSLEYLNPVVKAVGSTAGNITCEFSSVKPLRIEFKVANIGRIHFYLAPRVES